MNKKPVCVMLSPDIWIEAQKTAIDLQTTNSQLVENSLRKFLAEVKK